MFSPPNMVSDTLVKLSTTGSTSIVFSKTPILLEAIFFYRKKCNIWINYNVSMETLETPKNSKEMLEKSTKNLEMQDSRWKIWDPDE